MVMKKLMDRKIHDIIGKDNLLDSDGEVGLEFEMEGKKLPLNFIRTWTAKAEGSLRDGGIEYVLRNPIPRIDVASALNTLANAFRKHNTEIKVSNRMSVHVHINTRDMTFKQWCTFLTLYGVFEHVLTEYAGDDRVGNLFCLRASDSDALIPHLVNILQAKDTRQLLGRMMDNNYRYGACNVTASGVFGSLEFRAFHGVEDPNEILSWVKLLLAIKDASFSFQSPAEVLMTLSIRESKPFLIRTFGDLAKEFNSIKGLSDKIFESARVWQDFGFCIDWDNPADYGNLGVHEDNAQDGLDLIGNVEGGAPPDPAVWQAAMRREHAQPLRFYIDRHVDPPVVAEQMPHDEAQVEDDFWNDDDEEDEEEE